MTEVPERDNNYFPLPGEVNPRAVVDRYGNEVSLMTTVSGRRLRMVHHTVSRAAARQKSTIYDGRNYLKFRRFNPRDQDGVDNLEMAGFYVRWRNGVMILDDHEVDGVSLTTRIHAMANEPFEKILLLILDELLAHPEFWERK